MSNSLHLEPVTPSQAQILTNLHADSFGGAAWNLDQITGSLNLDTTQGWIAFKDAQPVGFILYQNLPEQAEILTFCVHPTARRQNIGAQLLHKMIAELTQAKRESIFLEVAADNQAAINLYQKLGFALTSKRPLYYQRGAEKIDGLLFTFTISKDGFASSLPSC